MMSRLKSKSITGVKRITKNVKTKRDISNIVNSTSLKVLLILSILTILTIYFKEELQINIFTFFIVKRGIITGFPFWWRLSELFLKDASGVELFYQLKKKYQTPVVDVSLFVTPMKCVLDINMIQEILDNSPYIFEVGKMKYEMFETFMKDNVGVSGGKQWERRRKLNETVLSTGSLHPKNFNFHQIIGEGLNKFEMKTPNDFYQYSKYCTARIVFGTENYDEAIYDIFKEANQISTFLFDNYDISKETKNRYNNYLLNSIKNPRVDSLVQLCVENEVSHYEILHQIPHFIFPLLGGLQANTSRLLFLLYNHPKVVKKLIVEIKEIYLQTDINNQSKVIRNMPYLRKCIMELLRLNNPVVSMMRTLNRDYTFMNDDKIYKKGEQFLILLNPVLRDPDVFELPNQFIPERWNSKLEEKYHAISFSKGPQECPGKDIAIYIVGSFIVQYFVKKGIINNPNKLQSKKIDINNLPQMINPFSLYFN